jgi:hypothetical protein
MWIIDLSSLQLAISDLFPSQVKFFVKLMALYEYRFRDNDIKTVSIWIYIAGIY